MSTRHDYIRLEYADFCGLVSGQEVVLVHTQDDRQFHIILADIGFTPMLSALQAAIKTQHAKSGLRLPRSLRDTIAATADAAAALDPIAGDKP